ncbi:MAG TPA: response regulator transcription factor, partial [Thermoanaerobaculia bacterium]|nr:response regulator transcription factor [Thermoanaerobaculia bacterium]
MTRILIVEDDPAMSVALRDGFEFEKYDVEMAADGEDGLRMATHGDHDLIILDVMLPKKSGLDVCKELRRNGKQTPIIMLTARGQEIDKIVGLKLGADDYVTKPFSFMELLARVEAVLRRMERTSVGDEFVFGDVTLDFKTYQAAKATAPLDLTPREFRILRYFIDHTDEVVSREAL